ncbi:MAG TPA: 4Fe-4S dicluster domain-containing protein [Bacteroides sp.]|nr:4Fe-4S dicluster domain-containing protein [Bacteroides sp.]
MQTTKQRMVLTFPAEATNEPITYNLIKEYDVMINILNADVTHGREGNLLIEMSGKEANVNEALVYLESKQIQISPVVKTILFSESQCIHCGACASVCFSGALEMDPASRELVFTPEKCIACELCIKACPLQLFELNFGVN